LVKAERQRAKLLTAKQNKKQKNS